MHSDMAPSEWLGWPSGITENGKGLRYRKANKYIEVMLPPRSNSPGFHDQPEYPLKAKHIYYFSKPPHASLCMTPTLTTGQESYTESVFHWVVALQKGCVICNLLDIVPEEGDFADFSTCQQHTQLPE